MTSARNAASAILFRTLILAGFQAACPVPGSGQTSSSDQVKAAVERFLAAAGRQDLDSLQAMFAPGASIASASLREGRWVTASQSFDAWFAGLRAAPRRTPYHEAVTEFTVHVDDDRLAFVRADAKLFRDGKLQRRNIDYFTLLRDSTGSWRFVNGSYTSKPAQK